MVKSEPKIQSEPLKPMSSPSSSSSTSSSSSCRKKKYKGVRMRSWGSWVSEIRAPNQKTRIWLGSYSTPEAAARAYDAALLCLKGASANLNFPTITSSYHLPDTLLSPKSIQRVAAAAANSFADNAAAAATTTTTIPTTPTTPPSPPPPSSSSSISSASTSSSPSDQLDDDVSVLMSSMANEPMSMMASWYDNFDTLQSPKYMDQMFSNCALFNPVPTIEDDYEEGDIHLWNFC